MIPPGKAGLGIYNILTMSDDESAQHMMEIIKKKGGDVLDNNRSNTFDYKAFLNFIHQYCSNEGVPNPTPEQIKAFINLLNVYNRIKMD